MMNDILCIRCGVLAVDVRYFWNPEINSYEMEFHCTTIHGFNGCGFYRILPMNLTFEEQIQD